MIRKEAWPFYRTVSGVRLCWELEEPDGPKVFPLFFADLNRLIQHPRVCQGKYVV